MKFNRNLTIYTVILVVFCFILASHVSATDFNGTSASDLDNSIKTSDDGVIVLNNDLNFNDNGIINVGKEIVIDGEGHSIKMTSIKNNALFNVNDNLELKNLVLTGENLREGDNSDFAFIVVNSNSKLILNNVTFTNINIGSTLTSHLVLNYGSVTVTNSTVKNIKGAFSSVFSNPNAGSSLTFENSSFQDSSCVFASGFGPFNINNSVFSNINFTIPDQYIFTHIQGELNIYSSLFVDIYNFKGIYLMDIDHMGSIYDNVFLGFSEKLFGFDELKQLDLKNNYFGSNTPVEDGLLPNSTSFKIEDNIRLNITLPDGDDVNNLTVGKKIPVEFKLVGDADLLPVFTVNYSNILDNTVLNQGSLTFDKNNSSIVQFVPRKSGNGSIVLGYDLSKAINPSFNYSAYGELKNYSLILKTNDSIIYGDNLDVSIELKDVESNPVSGIVSLYMNGNYCENITVDNGFGSAIVSAINSSNIVLNAFFYHKSDDYNDVEVNKTINVIKKDLDFKYNDVKINEGEIATVIVTNVPDDLSSAVYVAYSDRGGYVYPENGALKQSFSNLNSGTYPISIFYTGDNKYNPFNEIAYVYVAKKSSGSDSDSVKPDVPLDDDSKPDTPDVPNSGDNVPLVPDVPDVPIHNGDAPDVSPSNNQGTDNGQQNSNVNSNMNDNANSNSGVQPSTNTQTDGGSNSNMVSSSENPSSSSENPTQDASTPQTGGSGDSLDILKAYDMNKVIDEVMNNKFSIPAILLITIALILLFVGYRMKKDDEEY